MNARTFSIGGIHPEENKLTHEVATKVAVLPKQAIFPLSQHIGAPAKPVVQKGEGGNDDSRGRRFCVCTDLLIRQWYRL